MYRSTPEAMRRRLHPRPFKDLKRVMVRRSNSGLIPTKVVVLQCRRVINH